MKILQILPRLESGGVERGTVEVAQALAHSGHEPIVMSEGGRMVRSLEEQGIRHVKMGVGRKSFVALQSVNKLSKFLSAESVDIVHPRSRLPAWITFHALSKMRDPKPRFVTSVHGLHSVSRYSSIVGRGERVEAVSKAARDYVLGHYGTHPDSIRVIYRGVDTEKYYPGFAPSTEWLHRWMTFMRKFNPRQLPILTIVGRISRLKGHDQFLSVVECLELGWSSLCRISCRRSRQTASTILRRFATTRQSIGSSSRKNLVRGSPTGFQGNHGDERRRAIPLTKTRVFRKDGIGSVSTRYASSRLRPRGSG